MSHQVRSIITCSSFVTLFLVCLMILPETVFAQSVPAASKQDGEEPYIQLLVRRATEGTVPERALAMRKLARIGFSTIVPVLEEGLSASDQRLRVAAVDALGQIHLPEATQLLREAILAEDELVATSATEFLTKRPAPEGIPALIDGLTHSAEAIRSRCRDTLRQWTAHRFEFQPAAPADERRRGVQQWRSWWDQHQDMMPEEWWLERVRKEEVNHTEMASLIEAIRHLTRHRSWPAVPELIHLLDHGRSPIRTEALRAVRTISRYRFDRTSDAPETVAQKVQGKWEEWWRANGGDGRVSWLFKRLKTLIDREEAEEENVNRDERSRIIRDIVASEQQDVPANVAPMLLGSRMDREVGIRILRERTGLSFGYHEDHDEGKRNRAVRRWREWLERWSNQGKLDWMIYELQRNQWTESRVAAAEYLGSVRDPASVRALIRHGLNDRTEAVREASLVSLRRLTGRQFDYRADASRDQRKAWRRRWQEWWRTQDQFFANRGY